MTEGSLAKWKIWRFLILFVLVAIICEILVQVIAKEMLRTSESEFTLLYRYDPMLGWFPKKNSEGQYFGSVPFKIKHNNRGFRDHDHGQKKKKRILFIGDSFVWGYDVNREDRFTELVQDTFPNWEVMNLGVSGYGTDQEYLLLQNEIKFYQPDVVFLMFNYHTDPRDNNLNKNYGHYYKPLFVFVNDRYQLTGVPVPKGLDYYALRYPTIIKSYLARLLFQLTSVVRDPIRIRNDTGTSSYLVDCMRDLTHQNNARFFVGFTGMNPNGYERKFCRSRNIPCVDVSTNHRFTTMGYHWTPRGHEVVGQKIIHFLREQGLNSQFQSKKISF